MRVVSSLREDVNHCESVMRLLRSRLSAMRKRPILAVLQVAFILVWALMIPAPNGSKWDSILFGAGWILLICLGVVALVGGRRRN